VSSVATIFTKTQNVLKGVTLLVELPRRISPKSVEKCGSCGFNPLNAELNPICHLLALLGAHHILYVRKIRVKLAFSPK
jgi:hypothetical protein